MYYNLQGMTPIEDLEKYLLQKMHPGRACITNSL